MGYTEGQRNFTCHVFAMEQSIPNDGQQLIVSCFFIFEGCRSIAADYSDCCLPILLHPCFCRKLCIKNKWYQNVRISCKVTTDNCSKKTCEAYFPRKNRIYFLKVAFLLADSRTTFCNILLNCNGLQLTIVNFWRKLDARIGTSNKEYRISVMQRNED